MYGPTLARRIVIAGLAVALIASSSIGVWPPAVRWVEVASAQGQDFEHPRREMTTAIFNKLKDALLKDYPVVKEVTLHFIDVPVANAWVNQKKEVYVARGLLDLLETEDQIAGVLSHELAHITLDHVPQQIQRNLQWSLLVLGLALAGDRYDPVDRRTLQVLHPLVMYGYSREAEREADEVGLQYAARAGYNPRGLLEALELLTQDSARYPANELWMTHPLPEYRLNELRRRLDPRMGIPDAGRPQWSRDSRAFASDPVEGSLTFIHASWSQPQSLPERVADPSRLPAALRPNGPQGVSLYPRPQSVEWQPLGVVVESQQEGLLTRTVKGYLEFSTPLGVARGPRFSIQWRPAVQGWTVESVTVEPAPPSAGGNPSGAPGNGAPGNSGTAGAKWLEAFARELARRLIDPAADEVALLEHEPFRTMHGAAVALQEEGFRLTPLVPTVRTLEGDARKLWSAAEDETGVRADAEYVDLLLSWSLSGPGGEELVVEQRIWAMVRLDQSRPGDIPGLRGQVVVLEAEPVPLRAQS